MERESSADHSGFKVCEADTSGKFHGQDELVVEEFEDIVNTLFTTEGDEKEEERRGKKERRRGG